MSLLPRLLLLLPRCADRAHRALAEHVQRHALPDHPLRAPVGDERGLGMIQHVDEAGRHGQAGGVHFRGGSRRRQIAHRDDAIGLHGHVLHDTGRAAAAVDGAVADHQVVVRGLGAAGDSGCGQ
ncbi:MAG: hypothetical protein R2708_24145 [Vicinamibacterales bacterium]